MPRENIVESFVVENTSGKLTDFISFYSLPSTVMSHPTHNKLQAAYSFYNVATATSWVDLMGDALILAKKVSSMIGRDLRLGLDMEDILST